MEEAWSLNEPKSHQDLKPKFSSLLNEASEEVMHSEEVVEALFQIFDGQTYLLQQVRLIWPQLVSQLKVESNFHLSELM